MVNYWKRTGYPPHIKARFAKANAVMVYGTEEMMDQDLLDQGVYESAQTDNSWNGNA